MTEFTFCSVETPSMTNIDDIDVFDSMRGLLAAGVDLDDRVAVEGVLINPYKQSALSDRFINWCIKSARANRDAGGLERHGICESGFVPPEDGAAEGTE